MAGIGAGAIWIGGWLFNGLICALGGLMIWEAARMAGARGAVSAGLLAAVALALALLLPGILVLPLLAAAALVGAGQAPRDKGLHVLFAFWILLGCYVTAQLRQEAGFGWMVWLVLVVVVSDVAGYFAGRMLGGPKFWPRVSPKKTWSGTLAGWVGAGFVGLLLAESLAAGAGLVAVSMLVGFAGIVIILRPGMIEIGLPELAILGSAALYGVLDRFDAMLGAAMMVMVLWLLSLMPGLQ